MDLSPSISYFKARDVVEENIIYGLGNVMKLRSCLRSCVYEAESQLEKCIGNQNWINEEGAFF